MMGAIDWQAEIERAKERVANGEKPERHPWTPQETWDAMHRGSPEAAEAVAARMHDFERLSLALHLMSEGVASEAVRVVFDGGITQTHCFRSLTAVELNDLMRWAAAPLPPLQSPVTIFRGGPSADGISWTLSRDVACEFAERWKQADPKSRVFSRRVSVKRIAYYTNSREEQEVILWQNEV
ncbi:MAG: hypothetical protein INF93_17330 [Rhodobacter sp.]|nr:hypothetical protein [Rhodobacter sp.]